MQICVLIVAVQSQVWIERWNLTLPHHLLIHPRRLDWIVHRHYYTLTLYRATVGAGHWNALIFTLSA
jgi:hypothetical protein